MDDLSRAGNMQGAAPVPRELILTSEHLDKKSLIFSSDVMEVDCLPVYLRRVPVANQPNVSRIIPQIGPLNYKSFPESSDGP